MSSPFADDFVNPYAAPEAQLGGYVPVEGVTTDAEAMRNQYLKHEATVKALGALNYFGALVCLLVGGGLIVMGLGLTPANANRDMSGPAKGGLGALLAGLGVLNFFLGRGLRRLQPWARWTALVLVAFQVIANVITLNPIGLLVGGYFSWILGSSKSSVVFSRAYREVVAQTPHIRYRTSPILKFLLWFVVALLVVGLVVGTIGALVSSGRPR